MMEADNGNNCSKVKKMGNLSVPPGFASLTSFILKRDEKIKKTKKSTTFPAASELEPICMETKPEVDDITAYNQIYMHRPWIMLDQSNHKSEESHREHLPMDLPLNSHRPKGTIRGCPNCSNCLKVTARWHPDDARREILEEAPIFHPTEEEFKDTLKYIASIRSRAEPFGICRIVPPTCWKPPHLLEKNNISENSEFVAQIQRIDGHQVPHAQPIMTSPQEITTTKRRGEKVAVDSQLGDRSTHVINNQNVKASDCESESGPKFSLKTFKKFADEFKIQYFNCKDKNKIMGSDLNIAICQQQWGPSVENIEGEYGRIVQNPTEEIEVLCGNIFEAAGGFSSEFPTVSDSWSAHSYPEYLKSGWSLNSMLSLPGSLLSFESSEASRNFVPRIHVGMCFSPLNWKVEEHRLYSLCYMHLGEPKVWYSIPGRFAANFETVCKKYLPDVCVGQPDMHHNLVMQLSCSLLKAEGIPVYRCVQYPHEFVLVFPGAYYSGFDCGFNCSEAVSFAPIEWLPHGQNVVELYSEQRRKTLLSYDKLLLGAARQVVRIQWESDLCMKSTLDNLTCKDAYQRNGILTKALSSRIRSESLKRKFLCTSLLSRRMDETFDATHKRECSICLCDLHMSAIVCSCSDDKFACLNHAKQLCPCAWTDRILLYRYEIGELNVLCQALDGKLSAVYKWAKEDLGLTVQSSKRSKQIPENVASERSKQTLENASGSTCSSQDLKKEESISQKILDAYSNWKKRKSVAISNTSERKQNEVDTQGKGISSDVDSKMRTSGELKAKEKILGCHSAGIKTDIKVLKDKFTNSKKINGSPKVSSSAANSRYMSLLQDDMLFEVSSDSTSTSEADDDA